MKSNQVQQYVTGVLKGWITNKPTLDKFSESNEETLLWNDLPIDGEEVITPEQLQQMVEDTLDELNGEEEPEFSGGAVSGGTFEEEEGS